MAVILLKKPCEMETVNDLNGDLINLARVIQDREMAFELYDKLARTLYSEDIFGEAKQRWISATDVNSKMELQRAYDFFIASWMGLNGVSGTERNNYKFAMRWCRGGGQGTKRWQSVVESIPAWHKRLRDVVILRRDAFKIIDNIRDEEGVAIYCDPPYFEKSAKYVHDFEDEDHNRLAESLRRFQKSNVIVSYYDCPQVRWLYEGFKLRTICKSGSGLRNAIRGDKKKPTQGEVLLLNKEINKKGGLFE
jgi:DNA adenine methylase